jgi:hypothetical protein
MKKDGMRPIFIYRHHEVIPSFDIRHWTLGILRFVFHSLFRSLAFQNKGCLSAIRAHPEMVACGSDQCRSDFQTGGVATLR